ncbi:MAG: 2-oxo acid dehydrogenase subunit E2 [Bacteroidales bacterium]|nr:2-oxo acid dehydrogenase subunit E2 [Bacteroidales bacterium]
MAVPVIMPRQGQSVETCIISKWHKAKGDPVRPGDLLFSYETDKAAFDEEAKTEGVLLEIFFREGEEVPVLSNVAVIGQVGEDPAPFRPGSATSGERDSRGEEEAKSPATSASVTRQPELKTEGKKRISPRARLLARELGIDPGQLQGSGPGGRVVERDVRSAAESRKKEIPSAPLAEKVAQEPIFSGEDSRTEKLSNVRKLIAAAMHASLRESAQLTHHTSADARKLLELRKQFKLEAEKGSTYNITINDMVCYAVVKALLKHPHINAHFLGDSIKIFTKVHLGIAVDTERGLMVPSLRNANEYTLQGLSSKLKQLSEQCRKGSVSPDLLSPAASSFTVTNLGSYGIEMFTPVLNLPQVGILGVNTIIYRPGDLGNGIIGFIPVIGLSLTYDHRAIDGAPASAFLQEVGHQIESLSVEK